MAAFLGSCICTIMSFHKDKYSHSADLDIDYPSGNGYWPETVSESVSDRDSAAGKIFFTFCLISAVTLFISWYPYALRNVYLGPETLPCNLMYWNTLRQYCPTMGLFMLIGVSVYPSQVALETNGGTLCSSIHLLGAAMMFVGYMLCEFKCMEMFGMKLPKRIGVSFLSIDGVERRLRQIFVFLMYFFYCVFCVFEVLLVVQAPCCGDEWLSEGDWFNRTTPSGMLIPQTLDQATVSNTASGTFLTYKAMAYIGECAAGIFLILSHLTIWYYCEERHVNYCESVLDMVYDDHTDSDYEQEEGEDFNY